MLVIADTGPLRYLIAIDEHQILRTQFTEIWIPTAVVLELTSPSTPDVVRHFIERRPSWRRSGATATILPSIIHKAQKWNRRMCQTRNRL